MSKLFGKAFAFFFKRKKTRKDLESDKISKAKLMLYKASLARITSNYYQMSEAIKLAISSDPNNCALHIEWLAVALKHILYDELIAWRTISNIQKKEHQLNNHNQANLASTYRVNIENEIKEYCKDILQLLNEQLLPRVNSVESEVLYFKLKADFYTYILELDIEDVCDKPLEQVNECYDTAKELADRKLSKTLPLTMALYLNICTFKFDILKEHELAVCLAETFLEEVKANFCDIKLEDMNESNFYLKLLTDKLSFWKYYANICDDQ